MAEKPAFWSHTVGLGRDKVTVYEEVKRKRVLYLKWRRGGNWKYRSLAEDAARDGHATPTLLDEKGAALAARALDRKQKWAIGKAEDQFAKLRSEGATTPMAAAVTPPPADIALALGKTWAVLSDPETGKYRGNSPHEKEVKREFEHAVRILGEEATWEGIKHRDLGKLWRRRIQELRADGHDGHRGAEITVARFLAIASWLRDNEDIPKDACLASSSWKDDLRADWKEAAGSDDDYAPHRPRFSLDEMRRILVASSRVDPRLDLLLAIGAELRHGQVKRAMRSHLVAAVKDGKQIWRFRVPGRGKKKGTIIRLTTGQVHAVARAFHGYLRLLEQAYRAGEISDYRLFFSGRMRGNQPDLMKPRKNGRSASYHTKFTQPTAEVDRHAARPPISDTGLRKWFERARVLAKIGKVEGLSKYGLRRQAVDATKELKASREALQNIGGWSDTQVPDGIYAEQEQEYAQDEAAEVRAKIRGETDEPATSATENAPIQ